MITSMRRWHILPASILLALGCQLALPLHHEDAVVDGGADADADVDAACATGACDDAGDAGVDAAPFCDSLSPKPTFCADFDGRDAGWTDKGLFLGGTVTTDDGGSRSPPLSLRADVVRDGGTGPWA